MKRVLCVSLLCCLIAACQKERVYRDTVIQAESIMSASPDSSLSMLIPLQDYQPCSRRSGAEFAMVFSIALDKNYIDVQDDSLALLAWNYYKHRSSRKRMLSAYSLGRVQLNKHDYVASMLSFRKCLEDARRLGDNHYEGLCLRNMAEIYDETYDVVHSLECYRAAAQVFEESGENSYASYAKLSSAIIAVDMKDNVYGERVLRELENQDIEDEVLLAEIYKACMFLNGAKAPAESEKVIEYFNRARQYEGTVFSSKDYGTVGTAFGALGQRDSMQYYLQKSESVTTGDEDRGAMYFDNYLVSLQKKDYDMAMSSLLLAMNVQDSLVYEKVRQSVSYAIGDIYEKEASLVTSQKRNMLLEFIIILFVMTIAVAIAVLYGYRKRKELEDMLIKVSDVEEELNKVQGSREIIIDSAEEMIRDKVKNMRLLSDIFFKFDKRSAQSEYATREEVIDCFRKDLKAFRSDMVYIDALEKKLNAQNDNMMEKMRLGFEAKEKKGDRIGKEDWTILVLIMSGFSVKAISFFVGLPESTVGMRKFRYSEKISGLDIPEAEKYAAEYAKFFRVR